LNMKKIIKQNKGSFLWRIVFGIIIILFSLISLGRFNATAGLFYLIISIFVFIPGRIFKINNKWVKIGIVVIAIFSVGLFNHFTINESSPIIEEYNIGQEFILPNDPNFSLIITKAVEEYEIPTSDKVYKTNGKFLFIYFKTKYMGDLSEIPEDNKIPFLMSFGLKDSNNKEYIVSDLNASNFPQSRNLESDEFFYLYNLDKETVGLKLIFTEEKNKKFIVVDLGI